MRKNMGNKIESESVNQIMANEPSHETTLEVDAQSNESDSDVSSISSELYKSLFSIKYDVNSDNDSSQSSSSPVPMDDEINDEVQLDLSCPETNVFRTIDPAPITISTPNNEVKKLATVHKITGVKFQPNDLDTEKFTASVQPLRNDVGKRETETSENELSMATEQSFVKFEQTMNGETSEAKHGANISYEHPIKSSSDESQYSSIFYNKNFLQDIYLKKDADEINSDPDIDTPKRRKNSNFVEHFEQSSNQAVDEVESQADELLNNSSSRSTSPTSMANGEALHLWPIDLQEKLNTTSVDVNNSKSIELTRDSMAQIQSTHADADNEFVIQQNGEQLHADEQLDPFVSETNESIENDSSVKNNEIESNLNSNDTKSDSNGSQENANDELFKTHSKRCLNRSSSDESQPKRRCCNYQKNYIHVKGETVYIEIGVPKDQHNENYSNTPVKADVVE